MTQNSDSVSERAGTAWQHDGNTCFSMLVLRDILWAHRVRFHIEQTTCKQASSLTWIAGRALPLLLKSWYHWEMDGDQQLNFYYHDAVAIMDRFICQPKIAGKTYMKFERQELKQRIRQESKLPISRSAAHRHVWSPIAALTLCWQIVLRLSASGMHWTSYPMYYENCNCQQYPA